MALQSLIAELTGATPAPTAAVEIAHGKRLIVIFEDTLGALRVWQNELLKIDSDRLRALNISVACIPRDGAEPLLNGRSTELPLDDLRTELQSADKGKFEVLLLNADGNVLLRSDGPVTIEQLSDAIHMLDRRVPDADAT